jgi:hypothetical protein
MKKVVIREQNGVFWQTAEFDLDELIQKGEVVTKNDNYWTRKITLMED